MHFCVATYLIMGLVAQCTAIGAQHYKQRKDIFWSYRLLPNAHFPAHSALTPTEIKEAAKHLVDTILKENSHGIPRLRADSPEFIGDPDSVSINITSTVEVGGLMSALIGVELHMLLIAELDKSYALVSLRNRLSVEDEALLAQFHQGRIDFDFDELLSPVDSTEATHNSLSRLEEEVGSSEFRDHPTTPLSSYSPTLPSPLTPLSPSPSLQNLSPLITPMTTPLPKRDERSAPKFDPKNEALLPNFFEEFERTAKAAGIIENSEKMKRTVLGYLDAKTMKFWQSLDTFDDDEKTWEEFKTEILDYYPGATGTAEVTTEELVRVVETYQKKLISTTQDLAEYHREFAVVAKALRTQGTLSEILIAQHYVRPFPENIRTRIDTGLYVHYPTKKVGQAYTINEIRKVVTFLLSDASAPWGSNVDPPPYDHRHSGG
ncbi:uncharacterized protein C8R40DRAFT_1065855 [Lentinula edodes]|uniref:uncharacterized protein n=1 Tax=Lentinula edodes TaxID=5353 RepID=UPI001E8DF35B|nr:uncharacterized protein C8R40DRAFT_1065855 [Lentinula edodes]KAH7879612.1 hypothetical protein C8R40DRAFT_1065855 [Lentinula edodes]